MIEIFHTTTGVSVLFLMTLVTRGFLTFVWMDNGPVLTPLLRGSFWVTTGIFMRTLYWSVLQPVGDMYFPETWYALRAAMGGDDPVNAVFNIVIGYGVFQYLIARYRMIPDGERQYWHWWTAPFYPARKCIAVMVFRGRQEKDQNE